MSGAFSFWHILVVALIILVLFGRGKVSDLMADIAKGVQHFKKGMNADAHDTSQDSLNKEEEKKE